MDCHKTFSQKTGPKRHSFYNTVAFLSNETENSFQCMTASYILYENRKARDDSSRDDPSRDDSS